MRGAVAVSEMTVEQKVAQLARRVQRLDEDDTVIIEDLGKIKQTQENHGRKLNLVRDKLNDVGDKLDQQVIRLDMISGTLRDQVAVMRDHGQRLATVEGTLGDLGNRMEVIEGRLDGLDAHVEAVDGRLGRLDERMEAVEGALHGQSNALRDQSEVLRDLGDRFGSVEGTLGVILHRLPANGDGDDGS